MRGQSAGTQKAEHGLKIQIISMANDQNPTFKRLVNFLNFRKSMNKSSPTQI